MELIKCRGCREGNHSQEEVDQHHVGCWACAEKRRHTDDDKKRHPLMGHGMTKEQGWSHPSLSPGEPQ